MNETDWKTWIAACDKMIREGNLGGAATALGSLEIKAIPRRHLLELAGLCRRANTLNLGLRMLSPVIHERAGGEKGSPAEWAEYAVLLQRSGGAREALNILLRPGMQNSQQTALYTAYCLFNLWEYGKAIPFLQSYLGRELPPYARLIGQTNLAAAYNFSGNRTEGAALAAENAALAAAGGYTRLQCNNLELLAQGYFETGKLAAAQSAIEQAGLVLGGAGTIDQLYIRMWGAALNSAREKDAGALRAFRAEAVREKHYESVREADLLSLKVIFSDELFGHLYFGTPFSGYRSRVMEVTGQAVANRDFLFGAPSAPMQLDLQTGELRGSDVDFPAGSKIHQCLEILMRDRYKPFPVVALFSEMFPDEHFDIDSSPNRVYQAVSRTRQWIAENNFPLSLLEIEGRYSLEMGPGLAVQVGDQPGLAQWESVQMRRLQRSLRAGQAYSAGEIRAALALTPANFKRLSAWALEHGELAKEGRRAGTVYMIPRKSA